MSHPGGCEIGPRPIDLHIKALKKMGVKIHDAQHGFLYCETEKIKGCEIQLDFPSVGATENIMLAAVFADGETVIRHAAKEPEIIDLQKFLLAMGVEISGAGTSTIRIKGKSGKLNNLEHTVIPDRIVAGTYLVAAGITGGDINLKNVLAEHIIATVSYLREAGSRINIGKNSMRVSGPVKPQAIDIMRTLPYPGFPTDMQSQFTSLLSIARGTSIVVETIFENRYKHVEELLRMGADIKLEGRLAIIRGVKTLTGAPVTARDLRGGAALIIAALSAGGTTIINGTKHIDRGYEDIENKLGMVGAMIKREI
ncbi:MAG: UDP-N-acetylglucosamine 1-carboxyvinyltransferase [Clostridium sp.]|nr:UDP-N-acetylglucosamine 1-carboxyvinyltransferase [Clostridium sp.]